MINNDKISVGQAEDLTNKIFGELTVMYRIKNTGTTRGAKWRCRCNCGEITDVLASNLKKGHTLSCGCLQKKKTSELRIIDETGNRYGRLLVLGRGQDKISPQGKPRVTWHCQCDCGNVIDIDANSLRKGLSTSCGCYRIEQVANRGIEKYVGQTFHYITILNKTNKRNKFGESYWNCRCNICNNEFEILTSKIKTQISCGCLRDSYGISIIKALLDNHKVHYETEKIFDNCIFPETDKKARFDFYIENQYLLEFDGKQHFSYSGGWNTKEQLENTKIRDKIKNNWCKENNIPLIRIPYWAIDDLKIDDLLLTSKFLLKGEQ